MRVYQLQDTEGPFNLNIIPANHGKVEVSPKLDLYPENTEVILTAVPDSGYNFKAWEYQSGANPFVFTVNKNTTVIPVFYNAKEILSNGEFNKNWNPWAFYVFDNQITSYEPAIIDSIFVVDIIKSSGTDWHMGFQENGLSLKKASYKLTFDAWAEQSKQLLITVAKNYPNWDAYINKSANITTDRKSYELTIDMPVNDENIRLFFGIGRFTGKFYIDNISLTPVDDSSTSVKQIISRKNDISIYPNPSNGPFSVRISGINNFNDTKLELFSFDGKLLYQTNLTGLTNEINPGKIKPGIYIVKVKSEIISFTKKIVIN